MIDVTVPDVAVGAFALVAVILYAAWHEYRLHNLRDARLLAAVGASGLAGSAVLLLP